MENNKDLFAVDDSMLDEVSKINKLIEEEKKKQDAEELKDAPKKRGRKPKISAEETSITENSNNLNETNKESTKSGTGIQRATMSINPPAPEEILKMERLHLRVFDNSIDVLYRPNHSYVTFLPNDENGKAEVKRLAELSREEFDEYLKSSRCFKKPTRKSIGEMKNSSLEEWFKGAWSLSTKNLLKELGVENPIEEPICNN